MALAHKVSYEIDPALDDPRHFTGHVKVFLKNGKVIEETQPYARGSIEAPIPPEEIELKFRHNAGLVLSSSKVEGIIQFLRRLEQEPDVRALSPFLAP